MNNIVTFLKDFILLFILFFIIYYVFINKKKKSYSRLKQSDEIKKFIDKNNINLKKIKFKKVVLVCSIINSFIIAFTSTVILNIENYFIAILVGFAIIIILIYSLYTIAGRYFKKLEEKENV